MQGDVSRLASKPDLSTGQELALLHPPFLLLAPIFSLILCSSHMSHHNPMFAQERPMARADSRRALP